jgi:3-dehydroquinate synthase
MGFCNFAVLFRETLQKTMMEVKKGAVTLMIRVDLGPRSYDIAIVHGGDGLGAFAHGRCAATKAVVIADQNVMPHAEAVEKVLYAAGFIPTVKSVTPGENSKSLAVAARLYDALASLPADRTTPIVAVGGGVIGDLAGFVAATWHRGVPLLMVPTSLLAMVDSSVGGKVGVNHSAGKNLIGAIHQPVGVWIDTAVLGTLPEREYRSGLAEVVKDGVILDAEFFGWLEQNADAVLARETQAVERIITRCCELKAGVVERDERESSGGRMVLNYGHTFGHAFETVAGYGAWLHGEAVAAGMICASRLAERLGMIPAEVTARQEDLLKRFGLPTTTDSGWPLDALIEVMHHDKKAVAGRLRFVLPTQIGHVELVDNVLPHDVRAILS